jgi:hypothetical protein
MTGSGRQDLDGVCVAAIARGMMRTDMGQAQKSERAGEGRASGSVKPSAMQGLFDAIN